MTKDSMVSDVLNLALDTWNEKSEEMFDLLSLSPETFRGGEILSKVNSVSEALMSVSYALMVLFFLTGVFKTAVSFEHLRRPETAIRLLVKFASAKVLVSYSGQIMLAIVKIVTGICSKVMTEAGTAEVTCLTLPEAIETAVSEANFLSSVPLFAVSLIAAVTVWILSVKMILTIYGRFFRIYLYLLISPLPMAALAGEGTDRYAYNFIKSFVCVLFEGVLIAASIMIWSFFASSVPEVSGDSSGVKMVWLYMGQLIFNLMILDVLIKSSDRAMKEMIF